MTLALDKRSDGRANQSYHPVGRAVNDKRLPASGNLGTSVRDVGRFLWKEANGPRTGDESGSYEMMVPTRHRSRSTSLNFRMVRSIECSAGVRPVAAICLPGPRPAVVANFFLVAPVRHVLES